MTKTIAHEFGYICGLPDDYDNVYGKNWFDDFINRLAGQERISTKPKTGHENHLMAEDNGNVDQHEINDMIPDSIKRQIYDEDFYDRHGTKPPVPGVTPTPNQ